MKVEQNPFSLYDFLGYFVPGSILTYSFLYFSELNQSSNILEFVKAINFGGFDSYLPFIIASYTLGQALSFLSSYTIERFCIWHYSYPFRFLMNFDHDGYINKKIHSNRTIFLRVSMAIFLLPISILDLIIDKIFKVRYLKNRKFTVEFKKLLTLKFDSLISNSSGGSISMQINNHDNFHLIYHYTIENSKNHISKFSNYVALYGFSRSICLILVLNFWGFLTYQLYTQSLLGFEDVFVLLTISIVGYIFYLSYCKFLRRYSTEVLMAFVIL